jgi:KDO2-lipid IV(A) lauroyltransferase
VLSDRLSHIAIPLAMAAARSLPPRSIGPLAWLVGSTWYAVDKRRRRRISENLRVALGLRGRAARAMARRVFRNMARVPIEVIWFERLLSSPRQVDRRCVFHGDWPGPEDSPGIFFTGHLGSWEVTMHAARRRVGDLRAVARHIRNPAVSELITAARGGASQVIAKHGGYRDLVRALREGAWVGIAGDQNAGLRGIFVPFFGLPASTWETPGRLALKVGVPLILIVSLRRPGPDLAFDLFAERVPVNAPHDASRASAWALNADLHQRLERRIRQAPEQYNFLHRRWKNRPPEEPPNTALPQYDHHRKD